MIDPKTLRGNWNYPTKVWFGPGRITELAEACYQTGISNPLLVTDPGLAKLPMIDQAVERLTKAGLKVGVFSDLKGNPTGGNVDAGLMAFRAGGHDGVIAFGGGSALDTGKAIALMSGQTRSLWDFEDVGDNWQRVDPKGVAPTISVATTSGTGSEVGRASLITDEQNHTKKIIFHPLMLPRIALADPELTLSLPAHLTAATGMDAFAHCLEAYCAPSYHPMADGVAVEGMRLVKTYLPRAVKDGKDLEARAQMMAAAMMGATAFQKGLGAIHSLSHPVGAIYDAHHGLLNAIFMPYVLTFNRPAVEDKLARLAAYLGLKDASFTGFLDWVLALRQDLGIPHRLSDINVGADRLDELSRMAQADPSTGGNPVPMTESDMRKLFQQSLDGRLN